MTVQKAPRGVPERDAVLVTGTRIPFLKSNGPYRDLMAHDLGRFAVAGLLSRSGIEPSVVDLLVFGGVVQDPRTSNLAREVSLGAGLPQRVPSFTTTLACISANVAATSIVDQIRGGQIDVGIAGGAETFSDPPIRLSKALRQALVDMQKAKSPADYVQIARKLSPRDVVPDIPSPAEFSTGLTMGQSCERLARMVGVTREETDAFAARSHVLADRAWREGLYDEEVVAVQLPPKFTTVDRDDGPRGSTTVEVLEKLKPAFDKKYGIITAGSSSFLTDGAAAVLIASRERARELGLPVDIVIRDYTYTAADPLDELLLGPAYSIPRLLDRSNLTIDDIDVWEIHEAFASQMVANLKLIADDTFAREKLGRDQALGTIPLDKVNPWGGSLSLGHPFGATGARLLTTAAHRLRLGGARYAVVSGCAAGGQGSAILLENAR